MISILGFFAFGIWGFLKNILTSIFSIIAFPILIVLGLLFSDNLTMVIPSLGIVTLCYLIGFYFLMNVLSTGLQYAFFAILAIFIV